MKERVLSLPPIMLPTNALIGDWDFLTALPSRSFLQFRQIFLYGNGNVSKNEFEGLLSPLS